MDRSGGGGWAVSVERCTNARVHACIRYGPSEDYHTNLGPFTDEQLIHKGDALRVHCEYGRAISAATPLPVGLWAHLWATYPTGHLWLRWSECLSAARSRRQLVRLRGAMSHAHLQRNAILC